MAIFPTEVACFIGDFSLSTFSSGPCSVADLVSVVKSFTKTEGLVEGRCGQRFSTEEITSCACHTLKSDSSGRFFSSLWTASLQSLII